MKSHCAGQKAVFNVKIYWDCEIISPKEAATADSLLTPFKTGLSYVTLRDLSVEGNPARANVTMMCWQP